MAQEVKGVGAEIKIGTKWVRGSFVQNDPPYIDLAHSAVADWPNKITIKGQTSYTIKFDSGSEISATPTTDGNYLFLNRNGGEFCRLIFSSGDGPKKKKKKKKPKQL